MEDTRTHSISANTPTPTPSNKQQQQVQQQVQATENTTTAAATTATGAATTAMITNESSASTSDSDAASPDPSSHHHNTVCEYTEMAQQRNITPSPYPNQQQQQQNNNNPIFKQFDSKTGQFLSTTIISSNNNIPFKPSSSFKSRSHSVPIIVHSSLRRLTNHNQIYRTQNIINYSNLNNFPNTNNTTTSQTNLSCGVMKKKSPPSKNHIQQQQQQQQLQNSSSLRNAIYLSQRKLNNNSMIQRNIHNNTNMDEISLQDRISYIQSTSLPIPLPPINLQCLKEIDLQEIVKNPQLRHDIIFDPLLQFRPNLDGDRGIKKKLIADKYWNDVENEIFVYLKRPDIFQYDHSRLGPLFDTLREVLLTIVPEKETSLITGVLDTELNIQELIKGSLIMSNLSDWLAQLFKHHCAPMRDPWVDKMSNKFKEADRENSLTKLIEGLKIIFQILEAMKLDIANHQIRLLRPALLSNAVEFEKQYFNSLMTSKKVNLNPSLNWFVSKYKERPETTITVPHIYKTCIRSILSLLSCRKMVKEYPTSLSFDHTRLILLRADIRQLVCLLVCRLLFQQLIANDQTIDKQTKDYINTSYSNQRLKSEIISIITDEHGNCRWTKNTLSLAIHLCKVINDLKLTRKNMDPTTQQHGFPTELDNSKIAFAKSWLSKQTQPLSEVYGVLENRVLKSLEDSIFTNSNCTVDGRVKQDFVYLYNNASSSSSNDTVSASSNVRGVGGDSSANLSTLINMEQKRNIQTSKQQTQGSSSNSAAGGVFAFQETEEYENIYRHLYTVINLHWSVFGSHYVDATRNSLK
ncbi:hypothetical protein NCAS_0I01930 [Naumovozyma castellii]|uniref:Protein SOK1 n=1 Tax=Naumovozyma castellii TaxID=27288 RepID=G0VK27_NAUCA|nr:hypothetical protein NCAS_0I01930 [Naumovozyma castellii CBS 4309]CCC71861.1 hypothetical protein NCAS_0I01930 [Naumovozyma castellii CBS 4309]